MYTYDSLWSNLEQMGLKHDGTLLAHTSMKAIGQVEGGAETVLSVLKGYHKDGGLFAMPALTWELAYKDHPVFDVQREPTSVGLLPEMFRQQPDVVRSWHPTHSMSAYGKEAAVFTGEDHLCGTPCGLRSTWHKLLERDAMILMIGCKLTSCTFLHGVEEWAEVPDRLDEPVCYTIVPPNGEAFSMSSRPHKGSPSEHYYRIEDALIESGALHFYQFGSAKVYKLRTVAVWETASKLLKANPHYFDA